MERRGWGLGRVGVEGERMRSGEGLELSGLPNYNFPCQKLLHSEIAKKKSNLNELTMAYIISRKKAYMQNKSTRPQYPL